MSKSVRFVEKAKNRKNPAKMAVIPPSGKLLDAIGIYSWSSGCLQIVIDFGGDFCDLCDFGSVLVVSLVNSVIWD